MADLTVDLIDQSIWERGVPYDAFRRLRREAPVYWHEEPDGPGFWALTLQEDIRAVSKDPGRFSSAAAGVSRLDVTDPVALAAYRTIVIAQDPPAGSSNTEGARVDLLVSLGPPPEAFVLPDLTGRPARDVETLLQSRGVRVGSKTVLIDRSVMPPADRRNQIAAEKVAGPFPRYEGQLQRRSSRHRANAAP